ncbi:methylated-DNA--[protein]-cysteine S-methyltransferase [Pseudolactococcus reticulitermitis]
MLKMKEGQLMYSQTTYNSPVGHLTLASDGESLIGLWLENQKYFADNFPEEWVANDCLPVFEATKKWLDRYFSGEQPSVTSIPLAPIGSEFRQTVWRLLHKIPYGQVMTYGELAEKIAAEMGRASMSSQAVGGAVGHNPISIIIPCHRVVGSDGSLTGYAGGLTTKVKLLTLEAVDMTNLYMPKHGISRN